ncbi:MAG: hypothetical protein WC499_02660 [Patescibacteria group bacterium]
MAKQKIKLLSPRGYLSHSALEIFRQSEEKYIDKYINGDAVDYENDFMELGKVFSTALETGKKTGDIVIDVMCERIPKYDEREKELTASFISPYGEITLFGKLDTFENILWINENRLCHFREYKTGSVKWTPKKAKESKQILHYATIIWLLTGKLPKDIWLDYIPTKRESDGEVRLTGEIFSFEVKLNLSDILNYMTEVTKLAVRIDSIYKRELNIK